MGLRLGFRLKFTPIGGLCSEQDLLANQREHQPEPIHNRRPGIEHEGSLNSVVVRPEINLRDAGCFCNKSLLPTWSAIPVDASEDADKHQAPAMVLARVPAEA
ncbi:hypothetical protein EJ06DRAFT_523572 [Trichodelitschia bisporula]|uniref:Uncharacterized protein n=1 Tax=Trichodelitschia bisporula TaxID=703511 RepID=A0A6G1HNQ5_9PEZI|nr:hypothetical protein EJ06DRAFT_523572 [Trichodelitschia bisporula]